ncbi:MAG TPA: hypothetical protein VF749_04720, partial [Candidatus Acidoferrum sp.]
MISDRKTATGRAFVKSLDILLRYARLYGFEHARTADQLWMAFEELVAAMPSSAGLLLGAAGSRLLLDGVPLEGAAEKQFAHLLSGAGLGSVQFFPNVTEEELARFVRAFAAGKAKPSEPAREWKAALAGVQGIRVNEIFFVATDSRLKESTIAGQLASTSLGSDQQHVKEWLNDPKKLLELIAAAQGSKSSDKDGAEARSTKETDLARPSAGTSPSSAARPPEAETLNALRAVTNLGRITASAKRTGAGPRDLQDQVQQMPGRVQDVLRQALTTLAARAPNAKPDESVLVQLAEHLAIRFALERFERGEVKVNAVRQ